MSVIETDAMTDQENAEIRAVLEDAKNDRGPACAECLGAYAMAMMHEDDFMRGVMYAGAAWARLSGMTREAFVAASGEWFDIAGPRGN